MKYEKSKAQQQRSDDGYKKSAKRQAAKMSRRAGTRALRTRDQLEDIVDTAPVFGKRYMDACTELDILDAE
jgi:hypothetical protein